MDTGALPPGAVMICESALEVLPPKALSPLYTAVMEWGEPAEESAAVLTAATPEPFKVALPRLLVPSRKATVPVGSPPLPLTAAVNVTALPATAGFCDEASAVALAVAPATPAGIPLL